jgi:hypothetical protein
MVLLLVGDSGTIAGAGLPDSIDPAAGPLVNGGGKTERHIVE